MSASYALTGQPVKGRTQWFRALAGLSAAALLVALLAHAYLGVFARYAADDYCTISILSTLGFIPAQSYWYSTWSGRYAFTFAVSLVELLGPSIVPVLPAATLGVWIAATTWTISRVASALNWRAPRLLWVLLALLLVFAVLDSSPDVGQSLYWQTGVVTYVAPLVLLTAYVGWLLDRARNAASGDMSVWSLGLAAAIPFVAGGTSETYAGLQIGAFGAALVLSGLLLRGPGRRAWLTLLLAGSLGALLAMALVAGAPGNAVRRLGVPDPDLLLITRSAAGFAVVTMAKFVLRTPVPAFLSLLLPAIVGFAFHPSNRAPGSGRWWPGTLKLLVALAAALFVTLVCAFGPAYFGLGFRPPNRALVSTQFVLVVAAACAGYVLGLALKRSGLVQWQRRYVLPGLALVVLLLVVLGPLASAGRTLAQVETASRYAAKWDGLDRDIRAARQQGETRLAIPPLPNTSNIRDFEFVGPDPEDWFNRCVARYYGLESIVARAS